MKPTINNLVCRVKQGSTMSLMAIWHTAICGGGIVGEES
jgi:hypothetical protein